MSRAGRDEREGVRLAEHPVVDDQRALGREQGAIDQAAVAGLHQVVGEQPLKTGERARTL